MKKVLSRVTRRRVAVLVVVAMLALVGTGSAQQEPTPSERAREIANRLDALTLEADSLATDAHSLADDLAAMETPLPSITGDVSMASLHVAPGELFKFDPDADTTLRITDASVLVEGTLEMKPVSPAVEHRLIFANVNEAAFVGGGMGPVDESDPVLATDPGLWVMGDGVLDIAGAPNAGWIKSGEAVPASWQASDETYLTPHQPCDFGQDGVAAYTLGDPIPAGSEAFNVTRNVSIEGTESGRSHIFMRSTQPQTVKHMIVRHMGPRINDVEVLGRWALHFHLMNDGSRGSVVEGAVGRDLGAFGFVPHESHGVTIRDTVAYDVIQTPFWWDNDGTVSHDGVWDHNLATIVRGGGRTAGYQLGLGTGNVLTDSTASGVLKDGGKTSSGYHWPELPAPQLDLPWVFENNVAHNNQAHGIFAWQNTPQLHVVKDFVARNNGQSPHCVDKGTDDAAIHHGAYTNNYVYDGGTVEGSPLALAHPANSSTEGLTWRNYDFDGDISFNGLRTVPSTPTLMHDSTVTGQVFVGPLNPDKPNAFALIDFVRVTKAGQDLTPDDFTLVEMENRAGSRIRVQRTDGTAYQIDEHGTVTPIPAFYP